MPDQKFTIGPDAQMGTCKGCQQSIWWIKTPKGRAMPCDADGTSHFATCPNADQFRNRGTRTAHEDDGDA